MSLSVYESRSCQTYEGGFGGEPWNEAHGGYAFCAVAALALLKSLHLCDMAALKVPGMSTAVAFRCLYVRAWVGATQYWLAMRQMPVEGGFQGRTNKLVDGCYSFWQGGTFAAVQLYEQRTGSGKATGLARTAVPRHRCQEVMLFYVRLQQLVQQRRVTSGSSTDLRCRRTCWTAARTPVVGSLTSRESACCTPAFRARLHVLMAALPHRGRDYYHSCYCLSGLSIAQHDITGAVVEVVGDASNALVSFLGVSCTFHERQIPHGECSLCVRNLVDPQPPTHPWYNIRADKADAALAHFASQPCDHAVLIA